MCSGASARRAAVPRRRNAVVLRLLTRRALRPSGVRTRTRHFRSPLVRHPPDCRASVGPMQRCHIRHAVRARTRNTPGSRADSLLRAAGDAGGSRCADADTAFEARVPGRSSGALGPASALAEDEVRIDLAQAQQDASPGELPLLAMIENSHCPSLRSDRRLGQRYGKSEWPHRPNGPDSLTRLAHSAREGGFRPVIGNADISGTPVTEGVHGIARRIRARTGSGVPGVRSTRSAVRGGPGPRVPGRTGSAGRSPARCR